ncbi:MAG: CHAD domain-containing protein [Acidaminococcaceae bacterium]|jgi:CHAD domain-containing protein|nr:CHAD domain-containing protein [Acidaminococcaceae bacterium]
MSRTICLEAVDVSMQANYTGSVCKLLGLKAAVPTTVERKFNGEAQVRYVERRLSGMTKPGLLSAVTLEGILVLGTRIQPVRDFILTYEPGSESQVLALAKKLCSRQDYVLVDANLKRRVSFLQGTYVPRVARTHSAFRAVKQYLLWQVYSVNEAWHALLLHPEEKLLVRQLRVKIRRLRSCLIFFKKLLPEKQVYTWQQTWRNEAESLALLRELDVALMTCDKMRLDATDAGGAVVSPVRLQEVLTDMRQQAAADFFKNHKLNDATLKTVRFYLWLQSSIGLIRKQQKAGTYAQARLAEWSENLQQLAVKYPDFRNMEDLHKIRIKVKRYRYVIQTLSVIGLNSKLLRKLKKLQDLLGFLHDDYINARWGAKVAGRYPKDKILLADLSSFASWNQGKTESILLVLPDLWTDFLQELTENRE